MTNDEYLSGLSDTGRQFHEMFAIEDVLLKESLDAKISYPQFIPELMGPLHKVVTKARERAIKIEVDRDDEIGRITRFLGFTEGLKFATPSAGEAIHTVLNYFSHPGNEVIIPDGSYARFPDFVESLPEARVVRWVDTHELRELLSQNPDESNKRVVLIEDSRTPAFAKPDLTAYKLVATLGTFRTVVYDCVNFVFNEDIDVQKVNEENRLHRKDDRSLPQSKKRIRVVSLSKALPIEKGMFPNVGIIAVSNAVELADLEQFKKGMPRKHSQTPPDSELFAMAELLHSSLFPQYIKDLRAFARNNFEYFRDALKTQVVHDGLNAFIRIDLQDFETNPENIGRLLESFGLQVLYSQLYFRKARSHTETWIRIPLVIKDRKEKLAQLEKKIKLIEELGRLKQNTKGIIVNTF